MYFKIVLAALGVALSCVSYAQEFSGYIKDAESGRGIPFASVYLTNVQMGTTSDSVGYFQIETSLPDVLDVRISAQFYETQFISLKKTTGVEIQLEPHHVDFDDIVVSSPTGGINTQSTFKVDKLKLDELNSLQSSSLAEAITNINGVQSASFGAGIAKPVIRGMQGVRVLTLVNGMRIENQQWGVDHSMAISQLGVESAEVIKGPSSLLFGADAFGGVLYLVDAPYTKQNALDISINSKYESVNAGAYNTLGLRLSKGKVRFNLYGLYADYSDYQVPDGDYALNTRYNNRGIKTSIGVSNKNWVSHLRYTLSQNTTGLPGHAHHHEEGEEGVEEEHNELFAHEQNRGLMSPSIQGQSHIVSFENKFFIDRSVFDILFGHTINTTKEFEESFEEAALNLTLQNSLYNLKYTHWLNENWKIIGGLQGMYAVNKNHPNAEEQLIPNYEQADNGIYALASFIRNNWTVQFGGRYDFRLLTAPGAGYEGQFGSPNFSAGIVNASKTRTVRFNLATGFRAPHISELLSDGEHSGALRYEIGNSELKSERSVQADLSYEWGGEHIELILNPYYSYIADYIYLKNTDSIVDELPVYQYNQVDNASLYGVDCGLHYHPHFAHWLHVESAYAFIRGEDFSGRGFALIPQAKWNNTLKFNFEMSSKFRLNEIAVQYQYYFAQNKLDEFETPSSAYQLLNVGFDFYWAIKTPIRIGVGVKNVLNEVYIDHLSRMKTIGIESPGRNFYMSLKYDISSKLR